MSTRQPGEWIRDLQRRTEGPVRVRLSPDFFVEFPVEVFAEHGPGYVSAVMLGLSDELAADLTAWQRWFDDHTDTSREPMELGPQSEWDRWSRQGNTLLARLRQELGPGFDVH